MSKRIKHFSPKSLGTIHFTGIGGIGMSGIAEILHNLGYEVQGSDLGENANAKRLKRIGLKIFIGQKEENINNISVVVRSSAVSDKNPEIVKARKENIPVIARADMLKEIMRLKRCVTVAGTHGKTTTTSLIAHMFEAAGIDPTVINGGILNSCNTNAYLGKGEWLVAEADESDGSFNKLPADIAVVTNIDPEHMEYYGSFTKLREAFLNFINSVPFYGFAVMCHDHSVVKGLIKEITDKKIISYGFSDDADIIAQNLKLTKEGFYFDLAINFDKKKIFKDVHIPMYGTHNVQNALAAIAVCVGMGIDPKIVVNSLKNFLGVKRRLTITGQINDITIIDDYGHHPTEIAASLKAVKDIQKISKKGNLIAIIQPHRYSRVFNLFNDFVNCLKDADKIYITDIYSAGEEEITGINQKSLIEAIEKTGKNVKPIKKLDNLASEIKGDIAKDDIIICLGAGDITKYANQLPNELKKII